MLSGYSDSDLAGEVDDSKSTGGMVFYLNESVITWVSQKQHCVALSSCEDVNILGKKFFPLNSLHFFYIIAREK